MRNKTRLEKLLGKDFIYKQTNILIRDYYQIPETAEVKIITDGKPITIKDSDIPMFCSDLLPVDSSETKATQVVEQTNGLLSTLQRTLLDNIQAVKENPGYVKQANTINSSVNSLIGLAKIQIQVNKIKSVK